MINLYFGGHNTNSMIQIKSEAKGNNSLHHIFIKNHKIRKILKKQIDIKKRNIW